MHKDEINVLNQWNGVYPESHIIIIINELHPEPNYLDDLDDGICEVGANET